MKNDMIRLKKRRSMLLDRWLEAENEEKRDLLSELIDIDEKLIMKKTEKASRFTAFPQYYFRYQRFWGMLP